MENFLTDHETHIFVRNQRVVEGCSDKFVRLAEIQPYFCHELQCTTETSFKRSKIEEKCPPIRKFMMDVKVDCVLVPIS